MNARLWVGFVVLCVGALMVTGACSDGGGDGDGTPGGSEASCSNGLDDNGDGKVDCADPTCQGNDDCYVDGGVTCAAQEECIQGSGPLASRYLLADPPALCVNTRCVTPADSVRIYFSADTRNHGGSPSVASINTRFVLKRDVDGNPVTCQTLKQLSDSKESAGAEAWAGFIEQSKKFNILGFSVVPVSPPQSPGAGVAIGDPLLTSGVGKDFLVWTEIWPGGVDSQTKLPTGNRIAYGCVETGDQVREITSDDDRKPDGGVGRSLTVILP